MSKGIIIPIDTCAVLGMQVATEKAISSMLLEMLSTGNTDKEKLKAIEIFSYELDEGKVDYD